ncbi:uncharacterized protein LOC113040526 [Carassius auratus]|uniref:Uncharacterized protein LOC113040526 n=1 Tax=Carassius auratus TaxID=7957 RepID=A0A6P6J359_CARAU|nr:uncharacterized protein LOC113040526 [Carassius auratus]
MASVPVQGTPTLSLRNGCKCVPEAGVTVEELLLVIGEQVGFDNIISASRMNKAVVVFLKSDSHVNQLTVSGIWVREAFVTITPLSAPATKIIISNVPPFITNETITKELQRFGKITSPVRMIPLGCKNNALKHVLSFRRQVFMFLNSPERTLEVSFRVNHGENSYMVYASTENLKCYECGLLGHKRFACPHKDDQRASTSREDVNDTEQRKSESEEQGTEEQDEGPTEEGKIQEMAVPFKIPKKKQPSDLCLDMQSPLSRLQDSSSHAKQWGSVALNGRTLQKCSSNGNVLRRDSQRSESLRPIRPSLSGERRDLSPGSRTRTCSDNIPRGATRGLISFKMNRQPIKISPMQGNRTSNKVSETPGFRAQCQTPTPGRDFTGNSRWRPKRASDTLLCHDENHTGASESSSFKIHRGLDPGELEEEETEGTQGHSPVKEAQRSSTSEDTAHVSLEERKLKSTGSVGDVSKVRWNAASQKQEWDCVE